MQWRKLLMSGGAALGGVAAYNFLAERRAAQLPELPGATTGRLDWRGHGIAYTWQGAGPAVLLIHSIGPWSWSWEWRHNVEALATRYTVYTLDLLGFGRSDRPAVHYTPRLYLALIRDVVRRVVGGPTALVGAGLSAAYATELAAADPAQFPLLVLVTPPGLTQLRQRPTATSGAGRQLVSAPVLGTAAWNTRVTRSALERQLRAAYYRDARVSEELVAVAAATTHQPGAKYAPAAWQANQLNLDIRGALRRLHQPTLLVWGAQAEQHPAEESFGYRALKRDLRVAILDAAGDFPHEEQPEAFDEVVGEFLERA
ncbi:MAG TPA: alpha/beta fold hydrolase [Gemmatimonadaceae bacterium]|nr:alpha/beta fold hydrolase [Gemmatimonadaceae bacterium]